MVNFHIQNFPHFLISGLKTFEISTSLSTISLLGMALSLIDWVQSLLPTAYNHDGYSMSQHWALKSKEEILWNIFHKLKKFFSSSLCIFDVVHLSGWKYFPSLLRWCELFSFISDCDWYVYEKYFMIRVESGEKNSSSSS